MFQEKRVLRYAGIGPRKTPSDQLEVMTHIAGQLSLSGWILSSGWGEGADQAFGIGAPVDKQIQWLPNTGKNYILEAPFRWASMAPAMSQIASQFHPYWNNMKPYTKALMERNVAILFGEQFHQYVDIVIYWQSAEDDQSFTSGTNHTRRIARAHEIPCFNIRIPDEQKALCDFVAKMEAGL